MKYKLRIGEFAKLKNVTTEALRHYDRVDLLKPSETDPETGYRYYYITQSEKLAIIIELKMLGFSIEEMKAFFENRQLKKTYDLLNHKREELKDRINKLNNLEQSIAKKLNHLSNMMTIENTDLYTVRTEPACQVAHLEQHVNDRVTFEWVASNLENQLIDMYPVIGSGAYGLTMSKELFLSGNFMEHTHLFLFIDDTINANDELIRTLPERQIACFLVRGGFKGLKNEVVTIIDQLKKDQYTIVGDIVIKLLVTGTTTQVKSEQVLEVQIQVE